jgi:hypothetical protein
MVNLQIVGIKILDIGFVSTLYFILAIFFCAITDKIFGTHNPENDYVIPLWKLWIMTMLQMWVLGVIIYLCRNIVSMIPFPLDGMYGYEHNKLTELGNSFVFIFIFMMYQSYFKGRLNTLYNRTLYKTTGEQETA